jgi:E3 ubiquitin-protein ligase HUWE1
MFFEPSELELLICGLSDIDVDDMRAFTTYHGFNEKDETIVFFWNVLRECSKEEKALFLQFISGSSKVPLDGFASLQGSNGVQLFNIHKVLDTSLLPTAHTCFNQLDLPQYETEEKLKEKLLLAIKECSEGFSFA